MQFKSLMRFPLKGSAVGEIIALLTAVLCLTCGYSNDIADAEKEVALLRDRVKNQEFEKIWIKSSTKFKDVLSKEDFINFIKDLSEEIDVTNRMQKHDSTVGWDPNIGHYVSLRYRPVEKGRLDMEQFLFTYEQGKWKLSGYHVTENK